VKLDVAQAGDPQRLAPPVADSVLVGRLVTLAGEQPLLVADRAEVCDVLGEEIDQAVGEVHDTLRSVLRCPDIDRAAVDTLDLPGDGVRSADEVHVAELNSGSFAEP
jgi:hypothetical protein